MAVQSLFAVDLADVLHGISAFDIAILAIGAFAVQRLISSRRRGPLPPGPTGWPIIGNYFNWPKTHAHEVFWQWRETYGDIISCSLFGQQMIVLNSAQLAMDLFDRKGANYSERPFLYFVCEIVGHKHSVGMSPYNKRLKDMRRVITQAVGTRAAVQGFALTQEKEVAKFLARLVEKGGEVQHHIRRLVGSNILNISHGYEVVDEHDQFIDLAELVGQHAAQAFQPGAFLVNSIHALRFFPAWFPGAGWKRFAAEMVRALNATLDLPYEFVLGQRKAGTARPSLVGNYLEGREQLGAYEEEVLKWSSAAVYRAGSDTTVSAIHTFFLAMTLHPDIQARAQAELDAVIGPEALPLCTDRERLPYVDALVKEVFRWGQIAPMGLIHVAKEDDVHNGYFIPKGSYLLPNIWGFTHDPRTYQSPALFDPLRFLKTPEHEPEQDPKAYIFGFGRRVCPGASLADATVWITCARVLATMDIRKAVDAEGRTIEPKVEYTSGLLAHPKPFECSIKPRSARAEDLIRSAVQLV